MELHRLGGPIMVPLIFLNIIILVLGCTRLVALTTWRFRNFSTDSGTQPIDGTSRGWYVYLCSLPLTRKGVAGMTLIDSVELGLMSLEGKLFRGVAHLRFLAQISTLLGFLGTIQGMVKIFDAVARRGAVTPAEVAGGLHEKLHCTWMGLFNGIIAVELLDELRMAGKTSVSFAAEHPSEL